MKTDGLKNVIICFALVDIVLIASIGYVVLNSPSEQEDGETLYIIEYTERVEEYNYTDDWAGILNETIIHPILFSNISYIDFFLEWGAAGQISTINMTISEPPNSTVAFDPNNSYEKTVYSGERVYEWVHIYCNVSDNFEDTWIYASSSEEALENTTVTNGQGDWLIDIWGGAYSPWGVTPKPFWWQLNIEVHYYDGMIMVGE
jgi:hypothetical protein